MLKKISFACLLSFLSCHIYANSTQHDLSRYKKFDDSLTNKTHEVTKWKIQPGPFIGYTIPSDPNNRQIQKLLVHVNPSSDTVTLECNGSVFKIQEETTVICERSLDTSVMMYIDESDETKGAAGTIEFIMESSLATMH